MAPVTPAEIEILRVDPDRLPEILAQPLPDGSVRPWLDLDRPTGGDGWPPTLGTASALCLRTGPGVEELGVSQGRAQFLSPDIVRQDAARLSKVMDEGLLAIGQAPAYLRRMLADAAERVKATTQAKADLVIGASRRGDALVIWMPRYQEGDCEQATAQLEILKRRAASTGRKGTGVMLFAATVLVVMSIVMYRTDGAVHAAYTARHHQPMPFDPVSAALPFMMLGLAVWILFMHFGMKRFRRNLLGAAAGDDRRRPGGGP